MGIFAHEDMSLDRQQSLLVAFGHLPNLQLHIGLLGKLVGVSERSTSGGCVMNVARRTDLMAADTIRQATVLVVDDDAQLREIVASYLSDDYAVLEAESAATAVALLSTTSVDFVLSDVKMPGSMDGFALAAWLGQSIRSCRFY